MSGTRVAMWTAFFLGLVCVSGGASASSISVDRLGYAAEGPKWAVWYADEGRGETGFVLVNPDGGSVFSAPFEPPARYEGRLSSLIEFGSFQMEGIYRIRVGDVVSETLEIRPRGILDPARILESYMKLSEGERFVRISDTPTIRALRIDFGGNVTEESFDASNLPKGLDPTDRGDKPTVFVAWTAYQLALAFEINPDLFDRSRVVSLLREHMEYLLAIQQPEGGFPIGAVFEPALQSGEAVFLMNEDVGVTCYAAAALSVASRLLDDPRGRVAAGKAMGFVKNHAKDPTLSAALRAIPLQTAGESFMGPGDAYILAHAEYVALTDDAAARRLLEDEIRSGYFDDDNQWHSQSMSSATLVESSGARSHRAIHAALYRAYRSAGPALRRTIREHVNRWIANSDARPASTSLGISIGSFVGSRSFNSLLLSAGVEHQIAGQVMNRRDAREKGLKFLSFLTGNNAFGQSYLAMGGPHDGLLFQNPLSNLHNLALGRRTTVSTMEVHTVNPSLLSGAHLTDGSENTRWGSVHGVDPQWAVVDLEAVYPVDRIVIKWETARAKRYRIMVSEDGRSWKSVHQNDALDRNTDDVSIPPTAARYVKVEGLSRATEWGYSIWEIEVFSTAHLLASASRTTSDPAARVDGAAVGPLVLLATLARTPASLTANGEPRGWILSVVVVALMGAAAVWWRIRRRRPLPVSGSMPAPAGGDGGLEAETEIFSEAVGEISGRHDLRGTYDELLGRSPAMLKLLKKIDAVAPGDSTVLIRGEVGVGKELVAHAIHQNSPRRSGPFVVLNCAAIPEQLIETELFGIEKGVATGVERRTGKFEQANGGTIFLDEIGDMPLPAQAKILRVLQERQVQPVGSDKVKPLDVRFLAATNKSLADLVKAQQFRADLYSRLDVVSIYVFPLRERREDIPILAQHFLKKFAEKTGRLVPGFTRKAMDALMAYDWPNNVRELQNVVEQAVALAGEGALITTKELTTPIRRAARKASASSGALPEQMAGEFDEEERLLIEQLIQCDFNLAAVANQLGRDRDTVTQHVKGICLKAFSAQNLDAAAAARMISPHPDHAEKIEKRILNFVEPYREIVHMHKNDRAAAVAECVQKSRKLPNRYYACFEKMAEGNF